MEKANDREFAIIEFIKGVNGRSKFHIEIDDYKKDLLKEFDGNYKLGRSINATLKQVENIRRPYLVNARIIDEDENVIVDGGHKYNERFFNDNNEKTLIEFFATYTAANELIKFVESEQIQMQKEKLGEPKENPKVKTIFKLSGKAGAKINLIRILNALYELHLIEKTDDSLPTKEYFMENAGIFLGVDLSEYEVNLSQSFKNTLEINVKVFEEMKNKYTDEWLKRNKKPPRILT
jgi:hypothetical protein